MIWVGLLFALGLIVLGIVVWKAEAVGEVIEVISAAQDSVLLTSLMYFGSAIAMLLLIVILSNILAAYINP